MSGKGSKKKKKKKKISKKNPKEIETEASLKNLEAELFGENPRASSRCRLNDN